MSNPKTIPSPTKPESHDGWIRKSELDEDLGRNLPIPTQAVSNEEFYLALRPPWLAAEPAPSPGASGRWCALSPSQPSVCPQKA